jgi:hypothetical protein
VRGAKTAAEQRARDAQEQLAAARQKRDEAATGTPSPAAEAESARTEDTEAEQQGPSADPDEAAGQPVRRQPKSTTRRTRHPRKR